MREASTKANKGIGGAELALLPRRGVDLLNPLLSYRVLSGAGS